MKISDSIQKSKFIVLGGAGQLGKKFSQIFLDNFISFFSCDVDSLDISDIDALDKLFSEYQPDYVINCAAYNQVDKAETDFETAYSVNAIGAGNISKLSSKHNYKAVHYSSDYVFDGEKLDGKYKENDQTTPINNYGKTKLIGEEKFLENSDDGLLLRLSWVYGDGQQNFIYKLKQWSKENSYLSISANEVSVPTSTDFIARNTLLAIDKGICGTFHLCPEGYASRYEWAKEIFRLLKVRTIIHPADIEQFGLPAKRPKFSAMDSTNFFAAIGASNTFWRNDLNFHLCK